MVLLLAIILWHSFGGYDRSIMEKNGFVAS